MADFQVPAEIRAALVVVLSSGSRAAARLVVSNVVATWYDLSHLAIGPEAVRFISLFDDTVDVWREEDFRLVGDLSVISRWSKAEEFSAVLRSASEF